MLILWCEWYQISLCPTAAVLALLMHAFNTRQGDTHVHRATCCSTHLWQHIISCRSSDLCHTVHAKLTTTWQSQVSDTRSEVYSEHSLTLGNSTMLIFSTEEEADTITTSSLPVCFTPYCSDSAPRNFKVVLYISYYMISHVDERIFGQWAINCCNVQPVVKELQWGK